MMTIWLAFLGLVGIVSLILPSDPQVLGGSTALLPAIAWAIAAGVLIRSHAREFALLAFLLEAG
jgi:drug/metabolite transporter (DMT)-like permease